MPLKEIVEAERAFKALDKNEHRFVLVGLMDDEVLKFEDITVAYVSYLEQRKREQNLVVSKAGMWISMLRNRLTKKTDDFYKSATAYWLLKNGIVKGAPVEKELGDWLNEHPYSEDDYGLPRSNLRP